jgi:hypothetical protein
MAPVRGRYNICKYFEEDTHTSASNDYQTPGVAIGQLEHDHA